jgi:flagellar biosynthetic protein FliR
MLFEAEVFLVFALVLARISGLMIAAPVLGSANFPIIAKIGFSGLFAMMLTATLPAQEAMLPWSPVEYSLMAASELMIGLLMGFVLTLMFAAIQVAGQVMDMLAGFGMMNIFNPALETQVPILGFFFLHHRHLVPVSDRWSPPYADCPGAHL